MCSENPSNINKCSNARLTSDLMKFTVVNENLSKNNLEMFCSREKSTELIANQQNEKSTQIMNVVYPSVGYKKLTPSFKKETIQGISFQSTSIQYMRLSGDGAR